MPEVGDHFMEAEIVLPKGDEMLKDHVVAWSHDADKKLQAGLIQIQFMIFRFIKLNLLEVRLQKVTTNVNAESTYIF